MPSDFAPVRSILAAEREQGQPFSKAWKVALAAVENRLGGPEIDFALADGAQTLH